MNDTTIYTVPELITLPARSFDEAPDFKPELTRLENLGLGKNCYSPTYRVCYLDRRSLDPTAKSLKERRKVNLSSLCARRVSLLQPIVKALLEGHSRIPAFESIESVLNWIDQHGRSAELYQLEGARKIYRDYTDHLHHRLRLSNVGESTESPCFRMAQKLQTALIYVCGLACDQDPRVVQSWAIRIPVRMLGLNELPSPATTTHEHALAYALHQRFFDAFSQAVVDNIAPPVVVKLTDLGFEDLIYYSSIANNAGGWSTKGGRTDWQHLFYRHDGVFEGKPREFNALLASHGIAPIKTANFLRLKNNNRHFNLSELRELANHATRHFGHLLIAESGCNAAHLASIDCEMSRLDRAVGLAKARAIKGRASFEKQNQYVDVRFAQTTWRHFLKLRDWMSLQLETPPVSGIFTLGVRSDRKPYNLVSSEALQQLPLWPASAPSLSTRPARKHKSVNILEASGGNIDLAAGMQSATPQTIERHYSFKNREEAEFVMRDYFDAQAKSAELRHRGIKPVRIIEGGETTHAGICDSNEEGPELIEGFEGHEIQPRCGAPVTCIFCTKFALHADPKDIVRLLTIKLWVEVQSRQSAINIDDHFQKFTPYLNRIQQILDDLMNTDCEMSQRMKYAAECFHLGERDQYWQAKINALLDMQEI